MRRLLNVTLLVAVVLSLVLVVPVGAAPARADRGPWAPGMSLAVNDTVTYGGCTYKVLQAHNTLAGWEPSTTPALFQQLSCGGVATSTPTRTNTPGTGPTATRTATRTNTPTGPTATRTNTAVGPTATRTNTSVAPTATTGGGAGCWAPWVSTTAYSGGAQVSRNGQNYQAAFWTQGNDPATSSGPAGSGQPWVVMGACSGGTNPTATRTNTPSGPTPVPSNTPAGPGGGGGKTMGYFAQWGVYARQYFVKNIATSGSASKINYINYAFGNVSGGQCVIGDAYADYDMAYTTANSIDGVADTWDVGALRGSFNQLRKLKAANPNIKVLWSFGGWTWSGGFGQAAANPTAFANSCYNLVEDPRWADVFDGIDIDWEYPNSCGLSCDASGAQAYVNLMSALRSRFGSSYLVTAAIPAGEANINAANYAGAAQYVNWYNVMTYDFFGAFAAQGPTAPHSPLYSWAGMPGGAQAHFYSDFAIQLLKSKGIPANKLLLGLGFYGRGWTGVGSTNNGLNQPASGAATGTYEAGIEDYKILVNTCPANGTVAGTAFARCGSNWWSYDTPATIASKMSYMKSQGLGGAFFWEFSGDTSNGTLMNAIYNNR